MIKEQFLHHIWQFKKFDILNLYTTTGKKLEIINSGIYNTNEGPDFTFSKINVDGIEWNGNIEIHIKSSDWKKHNHDLNCAYKNIVLHVVYEDDIDIKILSDNNIPTLELRKYISNNCLDNYHFLNIKNYSFIPCENLYNPSLVSNSLSISDKLYIDKLQSKCEYIYQLLQLKNNDWEAVLAYTLAYTFGLKINAEAFEQIFSSIGYKIIRKISHNPLYLEALFLGLTHTLSEYTDEYPTLLNKEFNYLKSKFTFNSENIKLNYLRLRPYNFPTIRLSQLAHLFSLYQNLFSYVIGVKNISQYNLLLDEVTASSYWDDHYTFDKKSSSSRNKKLSQSQKDLIIINALLPIKFAYSQSIGNSMEDEIIGIISELKVENNSIINQFKKLGVKFNSALDSQAFLHLYKNKCTEKQCLTCSIGFEILK